MKRRFPDHKRTKRRKETEKNDKRGKIKAANDILVKNYVSPKCAVSELCWFHDGRKI